LNKQGRFIVSGHVQGVGFRYFVYRRATELNLTGYAKNLYNGNVEVIAEGNEFNLQELYKLLKQGPSRAYVEFVQVEYSDYTGLYSNFDIE